MTRQLITFPRALRAIRKAQGLAQEEFDQISSRTYISALERGLKTPTLGKVDELAAVLRVHPLTLLTLSYCSRATPSEVQRVLEVVRTELDQLSLSASGHGTGQA
ncbi:helix-turn-helix domain-containing protein [Rhizobacter sp. P5_C2]